MTEDKKLVLGFIGNGKSANRYHIPFVLARPEKFTIKTICNRTIRHDVWAQIPGVTYTTDINDLYNDSEIDIIVVSTPSQFHYAYAKEALNAGKHVICEKPFTHTIAEAEELYALAEEKGVTVQCYQNRRFDSDFLTVQEVINSGKLGDLLEMEMHYDYFRPEVPEGIDYFDPINSYLYGHGCHTLDQVVSFLGAPDRVNYDVRQLLGEGRMNDYFDLDLYYGKFKVSVKSSYFRIKGRSSFVVYGKKGMFEKYAKDKQETDLKKFYLPVGHDDFGLDAPEDYGVLTYVDDEGNFHEEKVVTVRGDYARYYDGIYDNIVLGKEQLVKPEQTLAVMRMLEEGISGLK